MSALGNVANLGTTLSNIQTAPKGPIPGWDQTYHALVSMLLSPLAIMPARHACEGCTT